jgi:ribosome recycling factor
MAYNFDQLKKGLKEAEEWLAKEYMGLRTGRATPALLDGVTVDSYGSRMNISSVASMTVEDARTIRIAPWDMSQVTAIEKAISIANLGVSAVVDDKGLRVIFPELTSERRTTLIKVAKDKAEDAKIRIRQEREKVLKDLQTKEKDGEMSRDEMERMKTEMEKMIKEQNAKIEELLAKKEKEITA